MARAVVVDDDRKGDSDKKGRSFNCTGVYLLLGLAFLLGGVLVLLFFNQLVDNLIKSQLVLREGSDTTKKWKRPPVEPLLRLYFFNVTNVDDFLDGEKPVLKEIGPYVYKQKWEKTNVQWFNEGSEVQYSQKKTYYFEPTLSIGSEQDELMLPNVPMLASIGGKMRHASRLVRMALASMLDILHQKPFVNVKVGDLVWGHDHPLVKLGNSILEQDEQLPFDQFGLFVGKNGTGKGLLRALTGTHSTHNIGRLLSFNGDRQLEFWRDDCNSIKGTDGSLFAPDIKKEDVLYIFNKDLCRSLPLVFEKEVELDGIKGYRFVPPEDVFDYGKIENKCFCTDQNKDCENVPKGLFNVSQCQFGSPVMLSWPHFFQADSKLLEQVDGLKPDKEKHQLYIDIQPTLGLAFRAAARSQINVVLNEVEGVAAAKGLRDMILPLAWFSDGIDELEDEESLELMRTILFAPPVIKTVLYLFLLISGSLLLCLVLCSSLKKRRQRSRVGQELQMATMHSENQISFDHHKRFDRAQFANEDLHKNHYR